MVGRHHYTKVADILRTIQRLEKTHKYLERILKSPHLANTFLNNIQRPFVQFLNWCVVVSTSDPPDALRVSVKFSLETIMKDMVGQNMMLILYFTLAYVIGGQQV